MSDVTDQVLDRLSLIKKLNFWKKLSIVLAVALLLGAILSLKGKPDARKKDHIARITISGMITDNPKMQKLLKDLKEDEKVKAVILRINSPGGSTTGGEMLYESIRELADEKPVIAVFGTVAASAAYMAGIASDHIVSRGSTITGSVGVLFQWPEVSEFMKKHGIKLNTLKSGTLKATPSPFSPANEESLAVTREMITDSFNWFIGLVKKRRKIDVAQVPGLMKGRVYTGRQALKYGLVDTLGGEDEARTWLEKSPKVPKKLKIVNHAPKNRNNDGFLRRLLKATAQKAGLDRHIIDFFLPHQSDNALGNLNGLMSLWHH